MKPQPDPYVPPVCVPREILLQAAMLRLGEIDKEVQAGYNILRTLHKTVTIFGSARTPQDEHFAKAAYQVAYKLAEADYAVITGGGHGIMEAANHGAFDAHGRSIGFNITLPHEQSLNNYTTDSLAFTHFAPRKIVMTLFADAYIYFPGGFGTIDELSEILTLIQTGKTGKAPLILFGSEFWKPLDEFFCTQMRDNLALITPGDEELYTITDDIDEVVRLVRANQTYCDH